MKTLVPRHFKRFGEVFGGAMWFYIRSNWKLEEVYYNDLDALMYNLFTCFKQYDKIIEGLKDIPALNEGVFSDMKEVIKRSYTPPDIEVAVAHIYLCTHIFSGVTGTLRNENLKMVDKQFKFKKMVDQACVKRLHKKDIRDKFDKLQTFNLSYDEFIHKVDHEDLFLYLDPPYWKTESYYKEGNFNADDHEKLSHIIKNSKCKWMISYYDFPELHEWFPENRYKWVRKNYKKVSSNLKKSNISEEVLIMNYSK